MMTSQTLFPNVSVPELRLQKLEDTVAGLQKQVAELEELLLEATKVTTKKK